MPTKKHSIRRTDPRMAGVANKKAQSYLRLPYARILIPEADGRFSAEILEFPGCLAQGDTVDEAFADLERAAELWLNVSLKLKQPIPPPSANHGYSGKFALRLPRDLHRLVARKAERDGVSVNQCLVTAIAAWVGADNLYERMLDRLQKSGAPVDQCLGDDRQVVKISASR
jgi:predicted RNase H-like HicB family nuclease